MGGDAFSTDGMRPPLSRGGTRKSVIWRGEQIDRGQAVTRFRVACSRSHDELANKVAGGTLQYQNSQGVPDIGSAADLFRAKGWRLTENPRETLCPDCHARFRRIAAAAASPPAASPDPSPTPTSSHEARSMTSVTSPTMTPAMRITRALNECYDTVAFKYLLGSSDLTVARELGLDVAIVERIRSQQYGPAVDPLDELRADLGRLLDRAAEFEKRLDDEMRRRDGRAKP